MAKIVINKGFISHAGRLYKAGEIVEIPDTDYAKRIVAQSDGDFAFYNEQGIYTYTADESEAPPTDADEQSDESADESANESADESAADAGGMSDSDNGADGMELPAINAEAAVKAAKDRRKKK